MGAIVGGLYASGTTTAELAELVRTLDWNKAWSDSSAREDLNIRGKQDDEDFPIRFELGVRDGQLFLPQGVIQGQRLDLVLRELTINSSQVRDFDEFPIPFRAIATDLATGEAYVMGEGDLALAIRASMSVPGAFAPVQVDERLLVDGGLVGNLGIEVMQQMGVDVIIAVNVEFPLYSKDELVSALDISEQVLTILVRKETLRQVEELDDDDILIRPDLGVFASTNFADSPELIEPGAIAARAHAAELERHAIDAEAWESYQARRTQQPPRKDSIDFVRVRHDSQVAPGLVERRMRLEPAIRSTRTASRQRRTGCTDCESSRRSAINSSRRAIASASNSRRPRNAGVPATCVSGLPWKTISRVARRLTSRPATGGPG